MLSRKERRMTNIQAINLLKGLEQSLDDYCELNDEGKTAFHIAIMALEVFGNSEQLPSAEPKRGKWILNRSGAYCCSECMEPCASYVMMKPRDKFCKMCGSRNEVTT